MDWLRINRLGGGHILRALDGVAKLKFILHGNLINMKRPIEFRRLSTVHRPKRILCSTLNGLLMAYRAQISEGVGVELFGQIPKGSRDFGINVRIMTWLAREGGEI